jgi:hypothetical protein
LRWVREVVTKSDVAQNWASRTAGRASSVSVRLEP